MSIFNKIFKREDSLARINKLIRTADTEDWKKRGEIKRLLIRIGKPAIPSLVSALQSPSWYVKNCASMALQEIGWIPSSDADEILFLIGKRNLDADGDRIIEFGPKAVEFLTPLLKDKSSWVRGKAASDLGKIGDRRATNPLIEALASPETVSAVANALADIGDSAAVEPLTRALKRTDLASGDKSAIADALIKLGVETEEVKGIKFNERDKRRKLVIVQGATLTHADVLMMSIDSLGHATWLDIGSLSILADGLLLGTQFLPFDEIVEVKAPKTLIGVHPTGGFTQEVVELGENEGILSIKWKNQRDFTPQDIVLRLLGAEAVCEEILGARKDFRKMRRSDR